MAAILNFARKCPRDQKWNRKLIRMTSSVKHRECGSFSAIIRNVWTKFGTELKKQSNRGSLRSLNIQRTPPCLWLSTLDLVPKFSLTTDSNSDVRQEDLATHGSGRLKPLPDFLRPPHGHCPRSVSMESATTHAGYPRKVKAKVKCFCREGRPLFW